jgi:hypothetical protein
MDAVAAFDERPPMIQLLQRVFLRDRQRPQPESASTRRLSDRPNPDPFSARRLYGPEKYSLRNMLLAQVGSAEIPAGHSSYVQYADRLYSEWEQASAGITSTESGDAFWHGVSQSDLMLFASRMLSLCHIEGAATAMRIIRFTNLGNGYPCPLIEIIFKRNGN